MDLIKWEDENGAPQEIRVFSKVAHKWSLMASTLGFSPGEIDSIRRSHPNSDYDCVTTMLGQWFDDAVSLPYAQIYPKSWQGLIKLMEDSQVGEVAKELNTVLCSRRNSVKGNLI